MLGSFRDGLLIMNGILKCTKYSVYQTKLMDEREMGYQPDLGKLASPNFGHPKRITVWNNGDFYGPAQELIINPNNYRTWTRILGYLTEVLRPPFGAVRALVGLHDKCPVHCFDQLKDGGVFVAVGRGPLKVKKNGYKSRFKKKSSSMYSTIVKGDFFFPMEFLQTTERRHRTIAFFMVSGRAFEVPQKLVLTEEDFRHWHSVLKYLATFLDLPEGVKEICTTDGEPIKQPQDIQHGHLYVLVPYYGKFIHMDYVSLLNNLLSTKNFQISNSTNNKLTNSNSETSKQSSASDETIISITNPKQTSCTSVDIKSNRRITKHGRKREKAKLNRITEIEEEEEEEKNSVEADFKTNRKTSNTEYMQASCSVCCQNEPAEEEKCSKNKRNTDFLCGYCVIKKNENKNNCFMYQNKKQNATSSSSSSCSSSHRRDQNEQATIEQRALNVAGKATQCEQCRFAVHTSPQDSNDAVESDSESNNNLLH